MKAIGFKDALPITETNSLLDMDLPVPEQGEHDLLVEVKAVSVNPVDVKIRASQQTAYRVLGWDVAGIVKAVGAQATGFQVGDAVYYAGALNRSGSNQQFHAVDARIVAHKPKQFDFAQAAALPLTTLTAWEALFERLNVEQTVAGAAPAVLIIGGAGGVGSIAIQLLKQLTNLTVIATASRPESVQWCKKMGADYVVDHTQPLAQQVHALNMGMPAFVFSTNQTDAYLADIAELIAPQGRIALIDDPQTLDINPLKKKSVSVHWEFMFTRSLFNTTDLQQQQKILATVAQWVDEGKLISTANQVLSPINAANLRQAHAIVESGRTVGKVVLSDW